MPGPARIVHGAAGENDEIGSSGRNDLLRLPGAGDQPDRHRGHSSFLAHLLAELDLVAGRERNLLPRVEAAGGDVHVVAASALSSRASTTVSSGVQPPSTQSVADTRMPTGFSAGNTARTAAKTSSGKRMRFCGAAAVFVGALVRQRRHELVQQIAVAAVQLDQIVADALDATRGSGELADQPADVVLGERVRNRPALIIGQRRRRFGLPCVLLGRQRLAAGGGDLRRALAAGVRELHPELGDTVRAAEIVHALERRFVGIRPHAGTFVA